MPLYCATSGHYKAILELVLVSYLLP
jgi:hypothetical protein